MTLAAGRFETVLSHALSQPRDLSPREVLAHELFNASFFETSGEARFLSLVMAVEVLLELRSRAEAAQRHVAHLVALTEDAEELVPQERDSIRGSLQWMVNESISQAGRRLARERLGDRQYMGRTASQFFTYCYGIRSRLVHGTLPVPTSDDIGNVVGAVQTFVSDLLAGPLLDV